MNTINEFYNWAETRSYSALTIIGKGPGFNDYQYNRTNTLIIGLNEVQAKYGPVDASFIVEYHTRTMRNIPDNAVQITKNDMRHGDRTITGTTISLLLSMILQDEILPTKPLTHIYLQGFPLHYQQNSENTGFYQKAPDHYNWSDQRHVMNNCLYLWQGTHPEIDIRFVSNPKPISIPEDIRNNSPNLFLPPESKHIQ